MRVMSLVGVVLAVFALVPVVGVSPFAARVLAQAVATPSIAAPTPTLLRTSDAQRKQYLADAVIWRPSGVPTPEQLRAGPAGRFPVKGVVPNADGEIPCTWEHGGAGSPGKSAKFTCRTTNGRTIRVKFYDGNLRTGNREVFAEVAATRLFWALGFDADPMYPVKVRCLQCPANPMTGVGPKADRPFLGVVEAFYEGTMIGSTSDVNQGWSFGEMTAAIASLPAGEHQARQQMYFDALQLLAVFVQHGDRKPSQQRLVCLSTIDLEAGDLQVVDDDGGYHVPVFHELRDARACRQSGITVQDLGATFGGGGQFTSNVLAKMHLSSWANTAVFTMPTLERRRNGRAMACRGYVTPSVSAGPDAEENPRVGEAGRRFLSERLASLTPAHLRAIFETARVTEIAEPHEWRDPKTKQLLTGVDAWVAVFQHKVEELGAMSCPE
jgi:hypothetical protein